MSKKIEWLTKYFKEVPLVIKNVIVQVDENNNINVIHDKFIGGESFISIVLGNSDVTKITKYDSKGRTIKNLEKGFYSCDFNIPYEDKIYGLYIDNIKEYHECLQVTGIVSEETKKLLKLDDENWYFVGYSPKNVIIGTYDGCDILEVCDQTGKRSNCIPQGWKMIVKIKGIDNSLLNIENNWFEGANIFSINIDYGFYPDHKEIGKIYKNLQNYNFGEPINKLYETNS